MRKRASCGRPTPVACPGCLLLPRSRLRRRLARSPATLCAGAGRRRSSSNDRVIHGTRGPDVIIAGPGPNRHLRRSRQRHDLRRLRPRHDRGGRGKDTDRRQEGADLVHGGRGSDDLDGGARPRQRPRRQRQRRRPRRPRPVTTSTGRPWATTTVEGGAAASTQPRRRHRPRPDRRRPRRPRHRFLPQRRRPIEVELATEGQRAEQERLIGIENVVAGPATTSWQL